MNESALINALSGFWHRFFADLSDLDALFRGVERLAEQFYVDMLHEVLGSATDQTFLSRRENYRLWRIKDTDVRWNSDGWYVKTPVHWKSLRYLQDGVLTPKTVLDSDRDFFVYDDRIVFRADPRILLSSAAVRKTDVSVGGFLRTAATASVTPGDTVQISDGRFFEVLYVNANGIGFVPERRVTGILATVSWGVPAKNITGRTGDLAPLTSDRISEIAAWALDGQVDDRLLYRGIGNLLGGEQPSTEQYRRFIRGVTRVYACGPSVRRLEEGLTAAAGLPLAYRDGEIVQDITNNLITTSYATYSVPSVLPLKEDIVPGKIMRAFETFTRAIKVVDHTNNPTWWYGITLPQTLMTKADEVARHVTSDLYENNIGAQYRGSVGDPNVNIGDTWRRSTAFDLMDRVLKYTMYGVWLDPRLDSVPGTTDRLQALVMDTRPVHAYPYVEKRQL